jgi:hypothetical protein
MQKALHKSVEGLMRFLSKPDAYPGCFFK